MQVPVSLPPAPSPPATSPPSTGSPAGRRARRCARTSAGGDRGDLDRARRRPRPRRPGACAHARGGPGALWELGPAAAAPSAVRASERRGDACTAWNLLCLKRVKEGATLSFPPRYLLESFAFCSPVYVGDFALPGEAPAPAGCGAPLFGRVPAGGQNGLP